MTQSKLLGQGTYGCVYYPSYSCDGKVKDKMYVSKLSKNNKAAQNEYDIGKLVKKIPNYSKKFLIVEKRCIIKQPQIDAIKTGCNFIKKRSYPSYVLLYSKYLKSRQLNDILNEKQLTRYKALEIIHSIYKRISQLYSVGVIHMDLHFANILISKKHERVYIIDFGLSLDSNQFFKGDQINLSYIDNKFFINRPFTPSLTLEYIFICLMVKENEELNKITILETITEYYDYNKVIYTYLGEDYIKNTYEYYKSLEHNSRDTNIKLLLQYTNTWDYYKLAYHLLSDMDSFVLFDELKWLLLLMMHPIPSLRPTKEELQEHFKNYLELIKNKD